MDYAYWAQQDREEEKQKKINELKCKNCGAPLRSDGVCEYCGSVYQISSNPNILPVLIHEPRAITLEADIKVPFRTRDYMTDEDIEDCVIEELRNKIASRLTECMLIQQSQDIVNMTTTYRGRVRLIPPSFKFSF